jgi:3-ketoacyl-CoA synthase
VRLSKELTAVAASALQKNMVNLGPLVLPFTEKFLFAVNLLKRRFSGKGKVTPYTPDFSLAFDHICIHSGECRCLHMSFGFRYVWMALSVTAV